MAADVSGLSADDGDPPALGSTPAVESDSGPDSDALDVSDGASASTGSAGSVAAAVPISSVASEVSYINGLTASNGIAATSYWTYDGFFVHKWINGTSDYQGPAGVGGGTVTYAFDTASDWTAAEQASFVAGLALWSAVANIQFVPASSPSDTDVLFVRGTGTGQAVTTPTAYDPSGNNLGRITGDTFGGSPCVVSIDTSVASWSQLSSFSQIGGYGIDTIIHEEGHVLGLGHAGPYNINVNPATQQNGPFDSRLWSVMSYIQPDNATAEYYGSYPVTGTEWGTTSDGYPRTPYTWMPLDIIAAQQIYGVAPNTPLSGGQVFGFDCNIPASTDIRSFFDFTVDTNPVITLYDTGTDNTLDLSGYSTNDVVDLNPGTFSSCDGMVNNIAIAFGTKIDAAVGGSGNDTFVLNGDNDTITGGSGTDTVVFAGASSQYRITGSAASGIMVTGDGSTDSLTDVRYLQFTDTTVDTTALAPASVASDFNDDGKSDILFQNAGGTVATWLMNGSAISSSAIVANSGTSWHAVATGDFNADGFADILFQNDNGSVAVWEMDGSILLASGVVGDPGTAWHAIATGDFNDDGKSDVLFQSDDGTVAVWEMNGLSLASSAIVADPGQSWHAVASGDFNGDGQADIVLQNDNGSVAIWDMNGAAIASSALVADPGTAWRVVGTGDVNGDGKSDVVLQNDDGTVAVWEMNGTSIASSAVIADPGPSWHAVAVGDYNGDGKVDLVLQNDDGTVAEWQLNGQTLQASAIVASPGSTWQATGLGSMHFIDATQSSGVLNGTILSDDFVLTSSLPGSHLIDGFDPLHDVVTLSQAQFGSYAAVQANETAVNGSTVITLGTGDTLTIAGVLPAALSAKNFV